MWNTAPFAFWFNTVLMVVTVLAKMLHYHVHAKNLYPNNPRFMYLWLTSMILFSSAHWGAISAWLIWEVDYPELRYPTMITMAAFAMGAPSTLSISTLIRRLYPIIIYLPAVTIVLVQGRFGLESILLATMAILSTAYITIAAKASAQDYYESIANHELAEQRAQQLHELSMTDPLTKLRNRMYFEQRFAKDWKRCNRSSLPLCIMMLDLDHFKQINDRYGHKCGDLCLQSAAQTLSQVVSRETDTIARFGGEEFVLLLPDTELPAAQTIASNLLQTLEKKTVVCQQSEITMTCSVGIACMVPSHLTDQEQLLLAADHAMYRAKENGRNQWQIGSVENLLDH
jgi:diguanylate cyclase (GGDEF)-like protein